jgi:hypothetical protein
MSLRSGFLALVGALAAAICLGSMMSARAGSPPQANAPLATITVEKNFDVPNGNDTPGGNQTFRIRGWNVALGTLDEVHIDLTATADIVDCVENQNPFSPCCAYAGEQICTQPTSGTPNTVILKLYDRTPTLLGRQDTTCASLNINLGIYDGVDDFAGTSGGCMAQTDTSTRVDALVYDHSNQAMLDYFTGDSVQLQYFRETHNQAGAACGITHYGLSAHMSGHMHFTFIGH